MKKCLLLSLYIVPAMAWAQGGSFTIQGKAGANSAPVKAYLSYRLGTKEVLDSSFVEKGIFKFKGNITEPVMAQLVLDHTGAGFSNSGKNADRLLLYLEEGDITLAAKDSLKNSVISGSKMYEDERKYKALIVGPEKSMALINEDYKKAREDKRKDQVFTDSLRGRYAKAQNEMHLLQQEFVKQNPVSYFSLLVLMQMNTKELDVPTIDPLFKNLAPAIKATHAGQTFAKAIESARATSVGALAPAFTQNDVNGRPVSLKDFRGKYVLLDFWASWCVPCRAENPNLMRAWNQYRKKNFTVLGVSLDRSAKKGDWLAAIKTDGLQWTQVSDLKFWDNEAARLYNVQAIPQNYLIDPEGRIIAKNLRGEELNKKLTEIFK